jgi:orotate phosphoribosyltransferase
MELVPTPDDVLGLLRAAGALRSGHFLCPSGFHTNQYLETALAMRHYCNAKILSVGLSRLLRANAELRAMVHDLSIVAATPAGLPVAYGLCEALRARQVYWTEKPSPTEPMRFRQYLDPSRDERAVVTDDVLRCGVVLREARALLESRGVIVVAIAALVHQPTLHTVDFAPLPVYSLACLPANYYAGPDECELCRRGIPLERISAEPLPSVLKMPVTAGAF